MSAKIFEAIMAEVQASTFTPEALKRMNDALEQVKALESNLTQAERIIREKDKSLDLWNRKESGLAERDNALAVREKALTDREKAVGDADKRVAVAEARAEVRKEVFDTIFRNVSVRRNVTSSVPIARDSNGSRYVEQWRSTEDVAETRE